jgi:hypothetical protein
MASGRRQPSVVIKTIKSYENAADRESQRRFSRIEFRVETDYRSRVARYKLQYA